MRRNLLLCVLGIGALGWGAACSGEAGRKLRVVATLFPLYDFARSIGGDLVDVSLLLPPGADSHSYEPGPSDLARLAAADLALYTGDDNEHWVARVREAVGDGERNGVRKFFDVSAGVKPIAAEDRGGHRDRGDGDHGGEGRFHAFDPHFWLDPPLAGLMAGNIARALGKLAADEDAFSAIDRNAQRLIEDLGRLHRESEALVKRAKRKTLVFGGRFAFAHFFRRYGLEQVGVYDGCGPGVEPSVRRIVEVVRYVNDHAIPAVYHEELAEPRIARAIAAETGAATVMLHSLHNLSRDEFAAGRTFVDLMRANIAALAKGLE
ncbi:MAG: zinc ABC transporter substrate-binding protein [Planctomycetota bacterium]|jgi:zinc transport system substrate-binding protein|nr:zinc ABC transporter substrate-binding protein [Planctomycetota bacterium]